MASEKLRLTTLKLLGRFPKTEEYENQDKTLRDEYAEQIRFGQSDEYAHFLSLKAYVESGEPLRVKNELKSLKYTNSEEHTKEVELIKLTKNSALKNYFRINGSEILNEFRELELSAKPYRYEELKQFVRSVEYKSSRKAHKKNNTEEYQKELEFKKLDIDGDVKKYFKLKKWNPLCDYFELENSPITEKYYALQEYIASPDFKERKAYLLSKDKFEQTEAFQKLTEYETLKKSEKIKWFVGLENTKKFNDIKRWELTFSDDFEGSDLNTHSWLTRYFWGEALIKKSYSLATDKHAYTDGQNIEVSKSILTITTRKEASDGLSWDPRYGFLPKSFDYTSGIVNTGQTFRQKYGRFEAKVRFTMIPNVYHAFWLVGEKMLPHVDIIRQSGKKTAKVHGSIFGVDGDKKKPRGLKTSLGGFDFNKNFFILGIDWTPAKMVWTINGIPYMETTRYLPNTPAYLVFSSGVSGNTNDNLLPATLEVDWVKCWRETNTN